MSTQITAAGIASATRAKNNQGPKINITSFKIGSGVDGSGNRIPPPSVNDPATDITPDFVYQGFPSQLQYAIVNDNTVEYIVTLDESVGPFDVGRIGLFMDNGDGTTTLFSITSIDAPTPDHKFPTSGGVVGNRLTYQIYLAISNIANIANFTIQLLQILSIPEVPSELNLPPPNNVAFNTYQVQKHSIARVPAIAYRASQANWFMGSERLIPGQGEGVVPLGTSLFDVSAAVGKVVGLDSINQKIILGEPATNRYILGLRSGLEEITNYGMYVVPTSDPLGPLLTPMGKLYADTGINAGKMTVTANQWPIGYALGPSNTTNAPGYLCWIDFTLGFGATGTPGPPGPQGPAGPPGTGGTTGFSNSGQCYLSLQSGSLRLTPFNGNNLIINSNIQRIPAGGVGLTAAGLQANTLYYIYAYMNGTVMTLEASTTSHITSSFDGIEIKNLDQSRTLVGMAYTVAGPAWADDAGRLYVVSWFNPRSKSSTTCFTAFHTTSGGEFVELGQEIRNYFINFANRGVKYLTSGSCGGNGGNGVTTAMSFDNNGFERFSASQNENGARGNVQQGPVAVTGMKSGLSETLHFGTLVGVLSNGGPGRAYWLLTIGTATHPSNPPNDPGGGIDAPVSLTIAVEG